MYTGQGFIQGGGGGGGGGGTGEFDPQSKCQGGYPPLFYLPIKVNCLQKSHIILKNNQSSVFLHHNQNSSESDSTASKSTSSSCGPSMAIIIASTVKKVDEVYYEVDS